MEITINREHLLKGLSSAQGVVDRKATMPILANCCLEAKSKTLRITATDLEVGLVVEEPSETKAPGKMTVGARTLYDIVKALPEERVSIKVMANNWVNISSGRAEFKIVGLSADEFPQLPITKNAETHSIDAQTFAEMLTKSTFAMSTDETRYNLNGIFLEPIEEEGKSLLRLVATDGHRLAYVERPMPGKWKLQEGLLVPRKGVTEWKKLLDGVEGNFTMQLEKKYITVESGNVTLLIRLLDGKFPPYRQVIPKSNKWVIGVDREAFGQALRRVQLVTTERARGVRFKVSPGHLDLSAQNPDVGEANEEIPINFKGETFEIGFNPRYFSDVLAVIPDEQVLLELKGEMGPCIIRSEFDKNFLAVIMPMRLN